MEPDWIHLLRAWEVLHLRNDPRTVTTEQFDAADAIWALANQKWFEWRKGQCLTFLEYKRPLGY